MQDIAASGNTPPETREFALELPAKTAGNPCKSGIPAFGVFSFSTPASSLSVYLQSGVS